LHESPSQLVSLLGESDRTLGGGGGQGGWDIKTIREKTGDRFLVESLDSDDPLHAAAEQALAQNELNFSVKDLSDEEIITVCNMRAARREAARLAGKPAPVDDCPGRERLGAIKTAILNTSAQRLSHRLDQVRKTLPDADRPTKDFSLYVYAHTHSEHGECRPKEVVTKGLIGQDTWNPGVVNTGAWQRLITPQTFNQMKKSSKKTLAQFRPEDLPACFSVIVVPAYQANSNAKPRPKLLFWSQEDESQNWDLHEYCSSDKGRAKRDPCM
jgi:hypothetical protein